MFEKTPFILAKRAIVAKAGWAALLLAGSAHIPFGWALESEPTPPVVGHKPVVGVISAIQDELVPGAKFRLHKIKFGEPVTAKALGLLDTYADEDGDPEAGSIVKWYQNGAWVHTGPSFTATDVGTASNMLRVTVIPKSSSGQPDTGDESSLSREIYIRSQLIDRFIPPLASEIGVSWQEADTSCQQKGARLPTRDELTRLIKNEVGVNYHLCGFYGWPTAGDCGGATGNPDYAMYWTNEQSSTNPNTYYAGTSDFQAFKIAEIESDRKLNYASIKN